MSKAKRPHPVQLEGRYGRRGTKWFSFDLPVDAVHPMSVVVTYSNDAAPRRLLQCACGGEKDRRAEDKAEKPRKSRSLFDVEYPVATSLVEGKQKITLRFEADGGNEIRVCLGIRVIRADAPR